MAHLSGFGLENFRVFKEYTWFDFAPITLLVGPNNSGKSSLIKALLLLKDNVDRGNLPPSFNKVAEGYSHSWDTGEVDFEDFNEIFDSTGLHFDGKLHKLGNRESVRPWDSNVSTMKFAIPFLIEEVTLLCNYVFNDERFQKNGIATKHKVHLIFGNGNDQKDLLRIGANSVYFDLSLYNTLFKNTIATTESSQQLKTFIELSSGINLKDWFAQNGFGERSGDLAMQVFRKLRLKPNSNDSAVDCEPVTAFLKNIDYWATNRDEQKKSYLEEDTSTFANLLKDVANHRTGGSGEIMFEGWAEEFKIQGEFRLKYNQTEGSYFPSLNGKPLTNFGFGYTQIFALMAKVDLHTIQTLIDGEFWVDSTLILEEPEMNLHPNWQAKLADLFSAVMVSSERSTQFIIETHSEYLIWRLQYLVLKKVINPEDVVIHYFNGPNRDSSEPLVKSIRIQENGHLTGKFGKGFTDETGRLMASLLTGEYSDN